MNCSHCPCGLKREIIAIMRNAEKYALEDDKLVLQQLSSDKSLNDNDGCCLTMLLLCSLYCERESLLFFAQARSAFLKLKDTPSLANYLQH